MAINGFMCGPRTYKYAGWVFEFHSFCGPWPLKKDGELRKRAGRKFYNDIDKFCKMNENRREKYRVGTSGGCIPF